MYEPRSTETWSLTIAPGSQDAHWASWALIRTEWRGSTKRGVIVTRGSIEMDEGHVTERAIWELLGDLVQPHLPTAYD